MYECLTRFTDVIEEWDHVKHLEIFKFLIINSILPYFISLYNFEKRVLTHSHLLQQECLCLYNVRLLFLLYVHIIFITVINSSLNMIIDLL